MTTPTEYGSDGALIYPGTWAYCSGDANGGNQPGGAGPGYMINADGTLAWTQIGNSTIAANCTTYWRKTYTYANAKLFGVSGWIKQ